jgi:hypothetical protein
MARRFSVATAIVMFVFSLAPAVRADVKTTEKTLLKLEGVLGRLYTMFGGAGAKDGVTSTVALKGQRLSRINDATGQIIDLGEEKVYTLDMKKKEYKVVTFAQMRQQMQDERDKAAKQAASESKSAPQEKDNLDNSGKQIEFDVQIKETGQHKTIAGYDTHEVLVIVTGHEKGKKIEESGGAVLTNDVWLGPKIPALDEIVAFQLKYFRAVYGEALGVDPQQLSGVLAMYPSFAKMAGQMEAEGGKLQGSSLATTVTFETVKSAEDMQAASKDQSSSSTSDTSLGSAIARRLASRGNSNNKPQQKTLIMTLDTQRLSVAPASTAEDVAIPAGFKEKK